MNKKAIPSDVLDSLVDRAIYNEAKEENIEFGHALKEISEKDLEHILNTGKKKSKFNKILWERIEWSIAVAALIAVAITVPISVENHSKNKICDIVYDYNSAQLGEMISLSSRSSSEKLPDITAMPEKQIEETLPILEERFLQSDSAQAISINGQILTFAYIRLHKRSEACKTLEIMIEKLSKDEDYESNVMELKNLLEQIK
ncbi:MAG: hypothetical protein J1E95_11045 [Muribaculaceae bacterium]|nr:hypothetical protein [Muribaculaceae bacterium]